MNIVRNCCVLIILLSTTCSYTLPWCIDLHMASGLGWHQFSSYEAFTLIPQPLSATFPAAEVMETPFDLMPYLEGRARLYLGHHLNITAMAGGGWLRKGFASIADYLPIEKQVVFDFVRHARASVNLAIVDAGMGYEFHLGEWIRANPLVGYIFNQESVLFSVFKTTDFYQMKNIWQGPYIGAEGSARLSTCLSMRLLYKFLFGHLSSPLTTHLAPRILSNPDGVRSKRSAHIYGDIFEFDARYLINDHWCTGTGLMYLHYRNHNNGTVTLESALDPLISKARIKQILWQQLMWTFFVEASF